jgi:hypothetical protein
MLSARSKNLTPKRLVSQKPEDRGAGF